MSTNDNNFYTTDIDSRVRIRTDIDDKIPILTIPQFIQNSVKECREQPALSWKQNGDKSWTTITFREYLEQIRTCAKAFLKLGLERHHGVCILGFNSPEWFISDLAAIFAGGVAAGIYTTNSPEACFHCCSTSRANIVVVEDDKQLQKILQIRSRLPDLKAIVQYSGTPTSPDVLSWKKLIEIGMGEPDNKLDQAVNSLVANECCTLVYTSGTVGNPKAVMVSHDNIIYNACITINYLQLKSNNNDVIISYLPLSHVAAQMIDIYVIFQLKAHLYFADKNALKGSLVQTLTEVQPTQFLAVPRVWEKIYEKMQQVAAQNGYLKRTIASWAKAQGLHHNLNRMNGINETSWSYTLANSLIFKRIKQALGFSRCENFFSAAAPLSTDIKKYFMSLDICIIEIYGMSESCGAHTANSNFAFRLVGIGRPIPGVRTKIDNPDSEGNGEICMMGRHIFMGYMDDLEKTKEALDDEGWLHSGDVGRVDENGFYSITGRIKELLITAGGENIPPVLIEQLVKSELPHISNAILIGDRRKFLSLLLTLKTEVDPNSGMPLEELTPETIKWLQDLGCKACTVTEVREKQDPKLKAAIQGAIDRVNAQAISNAQRIQKFAILPCDFSIPTGELGPTLKMKRSVITNKYADFIENFYKDA